MLIHLLGNAQGQNLLSHDVPPRGMVKVAGYAGHLFSMAHPDGIIQHKSIVPTRCRSTPNRLSCDFLMQMTPVPVFLIQSRIQGIFLGAGESL